MTRALQQQFGYPKNPVIIAGFDGTDYTLVDVDSEGRLITRNLVWDTSTLAWVSMPLTTGGGPSSDVNVTNWPADMATDTSISETNNLLEALADPYQMAVDEVSASLTYQGWADPTAATSAASWKIRRISISGTVTRIQWADGDLSFDNVWDNRASLTYGA